MELFSTELRKLWNGWGLQVVVLLSLILQIILTIFGSRRKYTNGIWIRIIVWSVYTAADWVPTVALSILANIRGSLEDNDLSKTLMNELHAFWAPFLLLHLGGPDTITAYSLEDNALWLRHFVGFIVQVGWAIYVILQSWSSSNVLTFLAIPVLVTGIIKFGERILAFRSSSSRQLKASLMSNPDDRPDVIQSNRLKTCKCCRTYLTKAYVLLTKLIYLFSDLSLGDDERRNSYDFIGVEEAYDAFYIVSTELGFLYDMLYTKASVIYSRWGIFFRCINFFSSTCVLVVYSIIIDMHPHLVIDIALTYLLLVWAVVLEVYSLISLLGSDWTRLWLSIVKDAESNPHRCIIKHEEVYWIRQVYSFCIPTLSKKWSMSMAQYNLINFCLKDDIPVTCIGVQIYELLGKYQDLRSKSVDDDLLQIIFRQVREKGSQLKYDDFSIELCSKLLAQRGEHALEDRGYLEEFRWSTTEVEFDESLLLWHIATDICFYDDDLHGDKSHSNGKISKLLSDYMLYLLFFFPDVLPKGIHHVLRYRDTYAEARRFFKQKMDAKSNRSPVEACKALLRVDMTRPSLAEKIGDKGQSVFFSAVNLAKQLQKLGFHDDRSRGRKWEMIIDVWVEMLMYAANNCEWKEHGQQLRKGGELLTHVRLLMVHLGLSEQYVIQKNKHARTLHSTSLP